MLGPENEGLELESRDAEEGRKAAGKKDVYDDNDG
jgi:hypothetical protein